MAVSVHRDSDGGVTEPLTDYLRVDALAKELGRVAVAKSMEGGRAPQPLGQLAPGAREGIRVPGSAPKVGEDEVVVLPGCFLVALLGFSRNLSLPVVLASSFGVWLVGAAILLSVLR